MNDKIRDKDVRLIDADGTMLGVMTSKDAKELAISKNLDLIKIVLNAVPPVCKIMDYGKCMFEQDKKEKEARKNQKVVSIKEVRLLHVLEFLNFGYNPFNTLYR